MKKRAFVMLLALAMVLSASGCANTTTEGEPSSSTITQEEYDALKEQNEKLQAELDELKDETDEETEGDAESGSSSEAETSSTADGSSSSSTASQPNTPATSGSSQSSAPASTSSQSSAQSQSGISTPAAQQTAASSGKGPLAKYTVNVIDAKTPATSVSGKLYNGILAYVFYSSSGNVVGTIPDSEITQILWDNNLTQAEDDEQKAWFTKNFNIYRGLDGGSYEGGSSSTSGGSSSSSNFDIDEFREEVIRLTNIEREKAGLDPLVEDSTAMEYAQIRAEELLELFSHDRPNGETGGMYSHYSFGENIAKGSKTPEAVVKGWMNSTGHRNTILADYSSYGNKMGVGIAERNGTLYWVQEFIMWDANA